MIPWEDVTWRQQVDAWIDSHIKAYGTRLTGEIVQAHVRPWSTVLTVPTDQGIWYFKATAPSFQQEMRVTAALANWLPDQLPVIVAVDEDRGWIIQRDAGVMLREHLTADRRIDCLLPILDQYVTLQQMMVEHRFDLLSIGITDRRLEKLPMLYDQLLQDTEAMYIGHEDGLSSSDYERLLELSPIVLEQCQHLLRYPVPQTLHHDDFHDGNIFLQGDRIIFIDWGESAITHPFFSLQVFTRSIAYRLKLTDTAPERNQLRDRYLAGWRKYATDEILMQAYELAQPLAMICRALTWYTATRDLPESIKQDSALSVPGWLGEFLAVMQE